MTAKTRQGDKPHDSMEIHVGDVVADPWTGRLLTVIDVTAVESDQYLTGRFVDSADEPTQTRHFQDVEEVTA